MISAAVEALDLLELEFWNDSPQSTGRNNTKISQLNYDDGTGAIRALKTVLLKKGNNVARINGLKFEMPDYDF